MLLQITRIGHFLKEQVVYYNMRIFEIHGGQKLLIQQDMSLTKLLQQLWKKRHPKKFDLIKKTFSITLLYL